MNKTIRRIEDFWVHLKCPKCGKDYQEFNSQRLLEHDKKLYLITDGKKQTLDGKRIMTECCGFQFNYIFDFEKEIRNVTEEYRTISPIQIEG
jgi:hypothetical protein